VDEASALDGRGAGPVGKFFTALGSGWRLLSRPGSSPLSRRRWTRAGRRGRSQYHGGEHQQGCGTRTWCPCLPPSGRLAAVVRSVRRADADARGAGDGLRPCPCCKAQPASNKSVPHLTSSARGSTPASSHAILRATAADVVFKFCRRNPKIMMRWSCHVKIADPPRLNGKVRHERGEEFHCRRNSLKRCCVGDEGLLALRSRPAGGGFKPPHAALAEDCRGERCGKGAT